MTAASAELLTDLERQRCEAIARGDLDALGALLAEDYEHTHANGRTDTRDELLESLRASPPRTTERGELSVIAGDDVATMHGHCVTTVRNPEGPRRISGEAEQEWVRRDGRWRLRSFRFLDGATVADAPPMVVPGMDAALVRHLDEAGWEPGERFGFPPGPECQVLRESSGPDDFMIAVVRFPPGFVEGRHVHDEIDHWGFILEGEMHTPDDVLRRGDFLYAPAGAVHGPFSYPVGCTIAGSVLGAGLEHDFERELP